MFDLWDSPPSARFSRFLLPLSCGASRPLHLGAAMRASCARQQLPGCARPPPILRPRCRAASRLRTWSPLRHDSAEFLDRAFRRRNPSSFAIAAHSQTDEDSFSPVRWRAHPPLRALGWSSVQRSDQPTTCPKTRLLDIRSIFQSEVEPLPARAPRTRPACANPRPEGYAVNSLKSTWPSGQLRAAVGAAPSLSRPKAAIEHLVCAIPFRNQRRFSH